MFGVRVLTAFWVSLTAYGCGYAGVDAEPTTVLVVRHAEQLNNRSDDPSLNEAGVERARRLGQTLRSVDIDAVYATQFLRTQQTARAVAEVHGADVTPVDADRVDRVVSRILSDHVGQTVLVVAHGDTAMQVLEQLGVSLESIPGESFADYNDLFVVTVRGGGRADAVRLKYGEEPRP